MIEIELRAFIKNFNEMEEKLSKIKARLVSEKKILDLWFCKKKYNKFEQVQQHKAGSYALRIRKTDESGKSTSELNCKVLKEKGDHNAFHEFETKIEDHEQTKQILDSIGFKIFCTIDKKRKTYRLNNCLINLEDIKGFKPAMELEIVDDKDIDNHKQSLNDLLDKLGIRKKDRIKKSITYLYMKEFSFKEQKT